MDEAATIELAAGDYRLALQPARGGSIAGFDWRREPLMRPIRGQSILDTACFPLVPFSNRIAFGRFSFEGRDVALPPNFPGGDHPHALHGMGWLAEWRVVEADGSSTLLRHEHAAGAWPWRYLAEQRLTLDGDGLTHEVRVTNLDEAAMPAGLGLHPYFPRTDRTLYRAKHRGEWDTSAEGLPRSLARADQPIDWWHGEPVGARPVDTVYVERDGPIALEWPERGIALRIAPSDALPDTVVYTPTDTAFFCVEPVSHGTDALNRPGVPGVRRLASGESFEATVRYSAGPIERALSSAPSGRRVIA